jgi:hypothetical protein
MIALPLPGFGAHTCTRPALVHACNWDLSINFSHRATAHIYLADIASYNPQVRACRLPYHGSMINWNALLVGWGSREQSSSRHWPVTSTPSWPNDWNRIFAGSVRPSAHRPRSIDLTRAPDVCASSGSMHLQWDDVAGETDPYARPVIGYSTSSRCCWSLLLLLPSCLQQPLAPPDARRARYSFSSSRQYNLQMNITTNGKVSITLGKWFT